MKKIIEDDYTLEDSTISLETLNDKIDWIKKIYNNCHDFFISSYGYDEHFLEIRFKRIESDKEYNKRLEKEKDDEIQKELNKTRIQQQEEFELFLKLKEKYENSSNK